MVRKPGGIDCEAETDCTTGLSGDGGADMGAGSELDDGTAALGDGVESKAENERFAGPIPRDPATRDLLILAQSWEDLQRVRIGLGLRGMDWAAGGVQLLEEKVGRQLSKALREHPMWPWLSQYPGLGGIHVARVIAIIGDPCRFPGPRSLWHYSGLHVVNGRMPKPRKGVKCDWNPKMRTAFLMPGGICEQIVRLRVPKYRDRYDMEKERLQRERGVDVLTESGGEAGPALASAGGVERSAAADVNTGPPGESSEGVAGGPADEAMFGPLRPFQVEQRARIIAGKAFLADLWRAWCEVLGPGGGVDRPSESETLGGPVPTDLPEGGAL